MAQGGVSGGREQARPFVTVITTNHGRCTQLRTYRTLEVLKGCLNQKSNWTISHVVAYTMFTGLVEEIGGTSYSLQEPAR